MQVTNAGLRDLFERTLSADTVHRLKPAPEPYRMAAELLGVPIARMRLVAAHAWDIAGALNAGCAAAFVDLASIRDAALLFPVDRQYSANEVHDGLMAEFSGTPAAAGGFSMETSVMGPPTDVPVISAGQEVWMEADMAPGYYVALCFIADPGSDVPHIMQGIIDTFEVTGG